jgi:hypothetical protein
MTANPLSDKKRPGVRGSTEHITIITVVELMSKEWREQ